MTAPMFAALAFTLHHALSRLRVLERLSASRTVKDLVAGADLRFGQRGQSALKGITEPVDLFSASVGTGGVGSRETY